MKTTILTLATIATLALGLGNTTYAAGTKDSAAKTTNEVSTVLTNVSAISKIEVRGNVEVFISDGDADQVRVVTPAEAVAFGATHIVVGRPITAAADPAAEARAILGQLA